MLDNLKKFSVPLSGILPYLSPLIAGAQTPAPLPIGFQSLSGFQAFICTVVVGWLFTFLIILAIVFVLVAAFKYLTAAGDPEKVKGASHQLIYAAVAVIVAILARGLPLIIGSLFVANVGNC